MGTRTEKSRASNFMIRRWPRRARRLLMRAFLAKKAAAGPTWGELVAELERKFGVRTNDSSISRYFGWWLARGEPDFSLASGGWQRLLGVLRGRKA